MTRDQNEGEKHPKVTNMDSQSAPKNSRRRETSINHLLPYQQYQADDKEFYQALPKIRQIFIHIKYC